jgi:predicted S18 family serine protease
MMKKLFPLMVVLLLVVSSSAFAASVSRGFSAVRVSPGDIVSVTLSASGVPSGEIFTLEDTVPQGWLVSNWNVQGAQESRDAIQYRFVAADNRHGWSFTAASSDVVITFDARVSAAASSSDYKFDAVFFDSTGQGRNTGIVTVRSITCGDGVCEGSENSDSCVADCPVPQAAPPASDVTAPEQQPSEPSSNGTTTAIIVAVLIVLGLAAFFLYTKRKPAVSKDNSKRR